MTNCYNGAICVKHIKQPKRLRILKTREYGKTGSKTTIFRKTTKMLLKRQYMGEIWSNLNKLSIGNIETIYYSTYSKL